MIYNELAHVVRGFLNAPETQETIFRPSELEAWLEWETPSFFDEALLSRFRRSYLGSGTMVWPNRRDYDERYVDIDGAPVRRSVAVSRARRFYHDLRGYEYLFGAYRALRAQIAPTYFRAVSDNAVGQPFSLVFPTGRRITEPALRHGYYLGRLGEGGALTSTKAPVVLEIGAGYGGLARLVRRAVPAATVILVDLPQRLSLQAYFLTRSFPTARVVATDSREVLARVVSEAATEPLFVLTPPWGVRRIPDGSVDVVINTLSMQEMRPDQIAFYVEEIGRIGRGFFYCVNRYEKRIGTATVRHPRELLQAWKTVYEGPQWRHPGVLEALYSK